MNIDELRGMKWRLKLEVGKNERVATVFRIWVKEYGGAIFVKVGSPNSQVGSKTFLSAERKVRGTKWQRKLVGKNETDRWHSRNWL